MHADRSAGFLLSLRLCTKTKLKCFTEERKKKRRRRRRRRRKTRKELLQVQYMMSAFTMIPKPHERHKHKS
ncbi:hypothetical protein V4Y02_23995, partial [Escherichia coli]